MRRSALIIAISHYDKLSGLDFCLNDGNSMYEVFQEAGYLVPEYNKLIGYVGHEKMWNSIVDFFDNDKITDDETIILYYSGHSVQGTHGDIYLAPSEIDPSSPSKKGIQITEVTKAAQRSKASNVVIILDCCFSGSAKIDRRFESALDSEGICILAASQAYQEAAALAKKNHSVFTYYLIQGLIGKDPEVFDYFGDITVDTLGSYIFKKIKSLPLYKQPKQTPIRKIEASGDIVLIDRTHFSQLKKIPEHEFKTKTSQESQYQPSLLLEAIRKTSFRGKITERTLYPILMQILKERGGKSVSEIQFNSEPDIIFELFGKKWILAVKIGETPAILTKTFIQYQRHIDESRIKNGILLFFEEGVRKTKPDESAIISAINQKKCTCLINTEYVKEEIRNITFPNILRRLEQEIIPAVLRKVRKEFPFEIVITLLRQNVSEIMQNIRLTDKEILKVITDKKLLSEIGHLEKSKSAETASFLASYIILSQILFLRLFSRTRSEVLPPVSGEISIGWLRDSFKSILDINYRPIFEIDVLDSIPETYVQNTFRLIWGLEIERIRYELPGRLFHELMPTNIRKMLAAFYTRPQAADLLARLTIQASSDTIYDPACGSGTILVSAYRRKVQLHEQENLSGNPHKRFCEKEIFGSDIMPFAVHLTTANLAAMDPSSTLDRTQIIHADSLKLSKGVRYKTGIQLPLFPTAPTGYSIKGESQNINLDKVKVVLMNPPFTKMERGIANYIDMERFGRICGKEVGLWGHFIPYANEFLEENGIFGGVIPISLLRGKESNKIREFILSNWTLLYVVKSTLNYGFSEYSEYRDVLIIAKKIKPQSNHKIKFILLKRNLKTFDKADISHIANQIEINESIKTEDLDIESFGIDEVRKHFDNLMWFCGVTDMNIRDSLVSFINKLEDKLMIPPKDYFREGFRPVPEGVSKFLFLTHNFDPARLEEAHLFYNTKDDNDDFVSARSKLGKEYKIEKSVLVRSLRTGIGIKTMDVSEKLDYICGKTYRELGSVLKATGFVTPSEFSWKDFWSSLSRELTLVETKIVILNRIGPYAPHTHHIAFASNIFFSPSNLLTVVAEKDQDTRKAFCVLLNSIVFLSQFFILKEETTGRYIHLRFYDFYEMFIFPKPDKVSKLAKIFMEFGNKEFASLREQLDVNFDLRYNSFWQRQRRNQSTLFKPEDSVIPTPVRITFDLAVCKVLEIQITKEELCDLYKSIVDEIIITRGLTKD